MFAYQKDLSLPLSTISKIQGTFTHEDTQEDPKEGDGQVNSQGATKHNAASEYTP